MDAAPAAAVAASTAARRDQLLGAGMRAVLDQQLLQLGALRLVLAHDVRHHRQEAVGRERLHDEARHVRDVDGGQEVAHLGLAGHGDPAAERVEDGAARLTVQYTCPGNGYGRTSIRRETDSLVQLESQGIHQGMPFEMTAEARRTGDC